MVMKRQPTMLFFLSLLLSLSRFSRFSPSSFSRSSSRRLRRAGVVVGAVGIEGCDAFFPWVKICVASSRLPQVQRSTARFRRRSLNPMLLSRWSSFACRKSSRPSFVPCDDLRSISSTSPPHSRCWSPKTERKLSCRVCFSSCLSQERCGDSPAPSIRAGLTETSAASRPLSLSLVRSRSRYLCRSRSCISAAARNLSPASTFPAPPLPRKRPPVPPLRNVRGRISAPSVWPCASPFSLALVFLGATCLSRKQVGHVYWTMMFTRPPLKYGGKTASSSPAVFVSHILRRNPSTFRDSSVFARHMLHASIRAARANRTELRSSGIFV
mmetsp:Transcript_37639/g.69430  ORF Transcript_37639/g.69430 Transcript_37639/m.69430 type:complete len:326 (-) Transcript_37639:578-1555(-)